MKNFEELLDRLNADHTRKTESKFEKELVSQVLYYYEGYEMDLEEDSYIPVFTSEAQAHQLELENGKLYANTIDQIPNPNGFEYVLNPMSHAIIFDQSIWQEGTFEVLGPNATELMFMMKSKAFLEDSHVSQAYLINIKENGVNQVILVVDSIPKDVLDESKFVENLQALFEGTQVRDVYSMEDKSVAAMVKGLKPYYKR